jgi:hypothetical protein
LHLEPADLEPRVAVVGESQGACDLEESDDGARVRIVDDVDASRHQGSSWFIQIAV